MVAPGLARVIGETKGRFTTLVVDNGKDRLGYCARIQNVSGDTVTFQDISKGQTHHVKPEEISLARCGKSTFRRCKERRF